VRFPDPSGVPEASERRNGVVGHIRWDIVEQLMRAGFWPDTFSTDRNVNSRTGVVDFLTGRQRLLPSETVLAGLRVPRA